MITALGAAPRKHTSLMEMEQTRANLKGEDFGTDNAFEAMVKYWRWNEVKKEKQEQLAQER